MTQSLAGSGRSMGRLFLAPLLAIPMFVFSASPMAMMHGEMGGRMGGGMPADKPMSGQSMQKPMPGSPPMDSPMGRMRMPAMGAMAPQSALPGFPGASHLYHVGATGFFLDHPEHIVLSTEQSAALNRIKEAAMLANAEADRRGEQAEQDLWKLTAAEAPDAAKIEGQIRAIEKLRGDQRMAFIRAVGAAAQVLTSEQRASLLGMRPAAGAKPAPMKNM